MSRSHLGVPVTWQLINLNRSFRLRERENPPCALIGVVAWLSPLGLCPYVPHSGFECAAARAKIVSLSASVVYPAHHA